jgi:hypothetical protein
MNFSPRAFHHQFAPYCRLAVNSQFANTAWGNSLNKLPKLRVILCVAFLAGATSSCALLIQGKTEEILVANDPPGATVTLNNGATMTTPFSIEAERETDLQLHFAKPGYQTVDISDNSRVEPEYLIVDTIPFMIPWAIDAGSGAGFTHQQTSIRVHLDPEESTTPSTSNLSTEAK